MWPRLVAFISRLQDLFTRRRLEQEADHEIETHLDLLTAQNIRRGMTPTEARRLARAKFGGVTQIKQTLREQTGFPLLESAVQDIGGAFRYFRRNRGFVAVAILILALGIGATTAVFSVSETLLLRTLPYPASDRLVTLRSVSPVRDDPTRTAAGTLADWQLQVQSFEAIAGYRWMTADVIDGGRSERLNGLQVTPEFFDVFGVSLVGRAFTVDDRGSDTVVLGRDLSEADDVLVGSTLYLNVLDLSRVGPTRYTVLGVATASVRFPPLEAGFELGVASVIDTIAYWMPRYVSPSSSRAGRWLDVVARLKPGVTLA